MSDLISRAALLKAFKVNGFQVVDEWRVIDHLITNAPAVECKTSSQQCEPVTYDKNKIRSNVMSKAPAPFGVCDAIDLTMNEMGKLITTNAEQQRQEQGKVVVTTNEAGQIVLVSRRDEEGRILSVIAESKEQQQEQDELIRKAVKDALEKALTNLSKLKPPKNYTPTEIHAYEQAHSECWKVVHTLIEKE